MSLTAMTWAFAQTEPRMGERLVLLVLADHADQRHSCFPSMRRIAERAGLTLDAARACVRRLEAMGLVLTVERRIEGAANRSNIYYLNAPDPELDRDEVDPFGAARALPPGRTGAPPQGGTGSPAPLRNMGTTPPADRGVIEPSVIEPSVEPSIEPAPAEAGTLFVLHPDALDADSQFAEAWGAWPNKKSRKPAAQKWKRLSARDRALILPVLLRHAEAHRHHTPPEFVAMLVTWLNQERWNDPLPTARNDRPASVRNQNLDFVADMERREAAMLAARQKGIEA